MQFHKLDKAKDKHFWSVRVGSDLRLIVHRSDESLLLCYVGHHDHAYHWAERRKLETHPQTGAAQLVEIRERVEEIVLPVYRKAEEPARSTVPLFAHIAAEALLGYGVPAEWLDDVRKADEDALLALADHLPAEAAEALLQLATGGTPIAVPPSRATIRYGIRAVPPQAATPVSVTPSPFDHPDAQRRFRVMNNVEELERALAYPWEKWSIFLHPEQQRIVLWSVFDRVRSELKARDWLTYAGLFSRLAVQLAGRKHPPFEFTVVDEAQDVSVSQLRFLAALGAGRPNGLFFAGDLGQRIFQQPFSWKSVGVDIRGRSRTLHINYRTSHQIRMKADRLLAPELSDVDGNAEKREGTISVFNGPPPAIRVLDGPEEEIRAVGAWLRELGKGGMMPHEMGVFVRSAAEMDRACAAVQEAGFPFKTLDENIETTSGHVSIGTMHLAKGLEFRAVAVMACDDEVIPLQERIETVADDADLEEVYNTERHLLYVACTRARDHLLVTGVNPASESLDDLRA
jgi:superfamily I DNA/RNA helicase